MPDRMPRTTGKAIVAALERSGWERMPSRGGSHVKLRHPDRPGRVVVPVHGSRMLPPGTLKNVLEQAGLTHDELRELL